MLSTTAQRCSHCFAASLAAIGAGAFILSKVDPGFSDFMGAASVKVPSPLLQAPAKDTVAVFVSHQSPTAAMVLSGTSSSG